MPLPHFCDRGHTRSSKNCAVYEPDIRQVGYQAAADTTMESFGRFSWVLAEYTQSLESLKLRLNCDRSVAAKLISLQNQHFGINVIFDRLSTCDQKNGLTLAVKDFRPIIIWPRCLPTDLKEFLWIMGHCVGAGCLRITETGVTHSQWSICNRNVCDLAGGPQSSGQFGC